MLFRCIYSANLTVRLALSSNDKTTQTAIRGGGIKRAWRENKTRSKGLRTGGFGFFFFLVSCHSAPVMCGTRLRRVGQFVTICCHTLL